MTEGVLGKTAKQLKKERITAKSNFTRQANFLNKGENGMVEAELWEEFTKLLDVQEQYLKLMMTTDVDYWLKLKKPEEEEEAVLGEQHMGDIWKTANKTEARFEEARDIVQADLWSKYSQNELTTAIFNFLEEL